MFKTSVNNAPPADVAFSPDGPTLNGEPFGWDIQPLGNGHFHILRNDRSYNAEVMAVDVATKTVQLRINGATFDVTLKDRFDLLLEQMGMSSAASAKINNLKAPMPGLIVGVNVQPGDVVTKGDSVMILEAMKMENLLKAPGEGTVKAINVQKGDRVEKGQVLIEFA